MARLAPLSIVVIETGRTSCRGQLPIVRAAGPSVDCHVRAIRHPAMRAGTTEPVARTQEQEQGQSQHTTTAPRAVRGAVVQVRFL